MWVPAWLLLRMRTLFGKVRTLHLRGALIAPPASADCLWKTGLSRAGSTKFRIRRGFP